MVSPNNNGCSSRLFALVLGGFIGLVTIQGGCGGYTSPFMRATPTPLGLKPPPGHALVVFIRPSNWHKLYGCTILDEDSRFVGQSIPRSHFAVSVKPGRHLFVSWAENVDALQAEVEEGKTYFIEVTSNLGLGSPQYHLYALKPASEHWSEHEEWIRITEQFMPDRLGGDAHYRQNRPEDVIDRMQSAKEQFKAYEKTDLERRTLRVSDGI